MAGQSLYNVVQVIQKLDHDDRNFDHNDQNIRSTRLYYHLRQVHAADEYGFKDIGSIDILHILQQTTEKVNTIVTSSPKLNIDSLL